MMDKNDEDNCYVYRRSELRMKNDKFFEEKIKKATSVNDMKYVPEDRTAENNKLILEFEEKQEVRAKIKSKNRPMRYAYLAAISVVIVAITLFVVLFPFNNENMEPESYSIVNPKQTYKELVFPNDSYSYERGFLYKKGEAELYIDVRYVYNNDIIDIVILFAGQEFPQKKHYTTICSEEITISEYNIKYKVNDDKSYAFFEYKDVTYYISYNSKNTNALFSFLKKLLA